MILTIGMIVKNEEKYLRSCLDAISPVLAQVDSELIIADTGSTDSTVEIAKEFTNNVFHFEWCDDFSAARNSTLEKASGRWYMALDADEIFEDCSEIIDFFNSGEYKNYASATYIIRSSNLENLSTYSDLAAFRLTQIKKSTRYINRIHETIPMFTPTKNLSAIANHYGYVSGDNGELIKAKSERNLALLFSELKSNPRNCKCLLEIAQSYTMATDYNTASDYYNQALTCAKAQKHALLFAIFADTAKIKYLMKQYSEVFNITEDYFRTRKNKSEIDLQMHFLNAASHDKTGNYKEALVAYTSYVRLYKQYHSGALRTGASTLYVLNFTDSYNYKIACMNLVRACLIEKDYPAASENLKLSPLSDWLDNEQNMKARLTIEMEIMRKTNDYSRLPVLFSEISSDFFPLLQNMLEPFFIDISTRDLILNELMNSDLPQSEYKELLTLRYKFFCKNSLDKEDVRCFFTTIKKMTPLYADAIYFALISGLEIDFLTSVVDVYELNQLLFLSPFLHFGDLPQLIYTTAVKNASCEDLSVQLFLSFLSLWALDSKLLTKKELIHLFQLYVGAIGGFLGKSFHQEFLKEESINLFPKYLRIGYYCDLAVKNLNAGEKSKYIDCLKYILAHYPEFKSLIAILLEDFQQKLDESSKDSATSEFDRYALLVKENIYKLINSKQYSQAEEILNSYIALCPNDPEIAEIKKSLGTALPV